MMLFIGCLLGELTPQIVLQDKNEEPATSKPVLSVPVVICADTAHNTAHAAAAKAAVPALTAGAGCAGVAVIPSGGAPIVTAHDEASKISIVIEADSDCIYLGTNLAPPVNPTADTVEKENVAVVATTVERNSPVKRKIDTATATPPAQQEKVPENDVAGEPARKKKTTNGALSGN
jgi:hypothetical protein